MRKIIVNPPTEGIQMGELHSYEDIIAVRGAQLVGIILYNKPEDKFFVQWTDNTRSEGIHGWKSLISYMTGNSVIFYKL